MRGHNKTDNRFDYLNERMYKLEQRIRRLEEESLLNDYRFEEEHDIPIFGIDFKLGDLEDLKMRGE